MGRGSAAQFGPWPFAQQENPSTILCHCQKTHTTFFREGKIDNYKDQSRACKPCHRDSNDMLKVNWLAMNIRSKINTTSSRNKLWNHRVANLVDRVKLALCKPSDTNSVASAKVQHFADETEIWKFHSLSPPWISNGSSLSSYPVFLNLVQGVPRDGSTGAIYIGAVTTSLGCPLW